MTIDQPLLLKTTVSASPADVFTALVEGRALTTWFAEHASVVRDDDGGGQYDFWGRYTPTLPDREAGRNPLREATPAQRVRYAWTIAGRATDVTFALLPEGDQTTVVLHHEIGAASEDYLAVVDYGLEDFWFLSLENLRRFLIGSEPVRFDFAGRQTGEIRHVVDIAGAPEHVFAALTEPAQLDRWFANRADVDLRPGGHFDLGWGELFNTIKILDIEPNRSLRFTWAEGPDTPASVVTWSLEGSGNKTRVTFVHSGFAPDRAIGGEEVGWLNFLSWLRALVEGGAEWRPAASWGASEVTPYYPGAIIAQREELTAAAQRAGIRLPADPVPFEMPPPTGS